MTTIDRPVRRRGDHAVRFSWLGKGAIVMRKPGRKKEEK